MRYVAGRYLAGVRFGCLSVSALAVWLVVGPGAPGADDAPDRPDRTGAGEAAPAAQERPATAAEAEQIRLEVGRLYRASDEAANLGDSARAVKRLEQAQELLVQALARPFPREALRDLTLTRFKVFEAQVRLGQARAAREVKEFALTMATSDDAEIASVARHELLTRMLAANAGKRMDAPSARRLADLLELYLDVAAPQFEVVVSAMRVLEGSEDPSLAADAYRKTATRAEEFQNPQMAVRLRSAGERLEAPQRTFALSGRAWDGQEIPWSTLAVNRLLVVDFFPVASEAYRRETSQLKRLHTRYAPEGLGIVTVSLDRKQEDVEAWVQDRRIPWTVLYEAPTEGSGASQTLSDKLAIVYSPSRVILDSQGRIVAYHLYGEPLKRFVSQYLAAGAPAADVPANEGASETGGAPGRDPDEPAGETDEPGPPRGGA